MASGYPHQAPDGTPVTTCLDWSGRDGVDHYGGGQMRPCRSCGQPALLVDADGQPQHKVCAEREHEQGRAAKTAGASSAPRSAPLVAEPIAEGPGTGLHPVINEIELS
jgi:hypothetical protein